MRTPTYVLKTASGKYFSCHFDNGINTPFLADHYAYAYAYSNAPVAEYVARAEEYIGEPLTIETLTAEEMKATI